MRGCWPSRWPTWPPDAAAGALSVLSPLGTQLIGLRVGDTVEWSTPDGRTQAAEVAALVFQPEAEGEFLA